MTTQEGGRPSQAQRVNLKLKGQHQETIAPGSKAQKGKPRQVNFRCPVDTYQVIKELGERLKLSDTDVLKFGAIFLQKNLQLVKDELSTGDIKFMSMSCRDAAGFKEFLGGTPPETLGGTLMAVLSDFAAIEQIGDDEVRHAALETLRLKINVLFQKAATPLRSKLVDGGTVEDRVGLR